MALRDAHDDENCVSLITLAPTRHCGTVAARASGDRKSSEGGTPGSTVEALAFSGREHSGVTAMWRKKRHREVPSWLTERRAGARELAAS